MMFQAIELMLYTSTLIKKSFSFLYMKVDIFSTVFHYFIGLEGLQVALSDRAVTVYKWTRAVVSIVSNCHFFIFCIFYNKFLPAENSVK